MNQNAKYLASKGRNGDTMLVHMSPQEVSGLQALARNNGTTMTINPHTGLPEAFSLGRLLPMIAGFALGPAGLGMSAMQAGLTAGALGTAATGSLREGIGIGLGAAGGAGLAGSMSSLAAPTAAATPAAGSVIGGSGMAGAGSGITVPATALNTSATSPALFNAGPISNVGLNTKAMTIPQAMKLPPLEGTTSALTTTGPINYGFVPNATGSTGLASLPSSVNTANTAFGSGTPSLANVPSFSTGATQAADAASVGSGYSGTLSPPKDIVSLKGPTMTDRFNRVVAGGEKAFGSMDAAGEFLGSNKMNLAMASAPMFLTEPEPLPEEESYIRPYSLDVENLSDRPASPSGREDERLRYKYTAGTPYRAAQGGIIAFAEGGNMTDGQEMNTNPAMMQRANEMQVAPFAGIMDQSRMGGGIQGYAEGGETGRRDVRKKINRMDDPYTFAAYQSGRGLYDAALQNFAAGGLSNVPRFLSGGGDGMSDSIPASINDRQPARLADGEFVIPADVVSHLGNGSSKAGAKQLYAMMDRVRAKRTGKKKQAPAVNPRKTMPA